MMVRYMVLTGSHAGGLMSFCSTRCCRTFTIAAPQGLRAREASREEACASCGVQEIFHSLRLFFRCRAHLFRIRRRFRMVFRLDLAIAVSLLSSVVLQGHHGRFTERGQGCPSTWGQTLEAQ